MGNKYPKIKLDLNREEEQKLQKLKRLKKFTSLPETFHYLLHSRTVLVNCKDILDAIKIDCAESQEAASFCSMNELSEKQRSVLLFFQLGLHEKARTGNDKRKTYDIFPSDRILVAKLKKSIRLHFGTSFSDTDIFKALLSQLQIANELSNEECVQFLEMFKKKLKDFSSFYQDIKDTFFVDDIIKKYQEELEEECKKSLGGTEQLSTIDLYIDIAVEQIDYLAEMICKK